MEYEIHVDISLARRYLFYRGNPAKEASFGLEEAAKLVEKHSAPRIALREFELRRENGLGLIGTPLELRGHNIANLLRACERCVLFCATIGLEVDKLIRHWQHKDMAFAAMFDACASAAVENLCGHLERELCEKYSAYGLSLTKRFSPGFGDFPLSIQRDFCTVLDTARRIGVFVNESFMMTPQKSVTAIIGLSSVNLKRKE